MSVLDIWNDAASQISNERISDLEEESPIARACRDQWPAIRDHLLSLADWKFSERRRVLSGTEIFLEAIPAGHQETRIISLPAALQDTRYRYRITLRFQGPDGGDQVHRVTAPITIGPYLPAGGSLTAPITYPDINVPVTLLSPDALVATSLHERILLTWDELSEATDYNYRWREHGQTDWTTVVGTDGFPEAVILNLENGTRYEFQAMAKNIYGISRWTTVVTGIPIEPAEGIGQAPPTPTGLAAEGGRREARLTWNPVSTATGYDYRYRSEGSWIEVTDQNIIGVSYIVSGLTNGTEYEFQIRARNEQGFSDWTMPSVTATPTGNTPLVPTGLEAFAGNATMLLTWNASPEADDYDVRYRLATVNDWTEIADTAITDTSIIIDGLTNDSVYQFSVRARITTNIETERDSDWSGHVTGTPSSAATPRVTGLAATAATAAVNLAWTAVSGAEDYDTRWRRTDVASDWQTDTVDSVSTETTRTVDNLVNDRPYEFQVRAQRPADLGGPGPWSDSASATPVFTPSAPAAAPVLSTSRSTVSRSILLTWTYSGDDVTGFEYRRRTGDEGAWGNWTTVGGDETTRSYRNYPGSYSTRYCYEVRAVNDAGTGGASNISCATTRSAPVVTVNPPGAVTLTADAGAGQVTLNWTGGSGATSFYYSQDGGTYQYAGSGSTTSRTITGLTNDTEYCFRVQARNSDGSTTSNQACATPRASEEPEEDPCANFGAPTNVRAVVDWPGGFSTNYGVWWDAVPGADDYLVDVRMYWVGPFIDSDAVYTEKRYSGRDTNEQWTWLGNALMARVQARSGFPGGAGCGISAWSEWVTAEDPNP